MAILRAHSILDTNEQGKVFGRGNLAGKFRGANREELTGYPLSQKKEARAWGILDGDGNTTEKIPHDLDGDPRLSDCDAEAQVDLGAFEVQQVCNRPPVAQCQNVTLAANGSCQASVTAAQINNGSSDPDEDALNFTLDQSGPFGSGSHPVTLTVSDGTLSSTCTATVTVKDQTAPSITCPSNQTATATSTNGAAVTFTPTANDTCGTIITTCDPSSGSTFPIGTTPVTCTATDGAGLQNSCSFTVTVTANALTRLNGLIATVQGLPVPSAVKVVLKAPLLVAKAALQRNKPQVACVSLRVFEGVVKKLRQTNKLTAAQAAQLTTASQGIRTVLGCP